MYRRLTASILALSVTASLLLFHHATGSFLPLVSGQIIQIEYIGILTTEAMRLVPAFYSLGAMLTLVTGISPHSIIYFPVQLLAALLIPYALIRRMSGSSVAAALLTGAILVTGSRGSLVLFYQHGLGQILLYATAFAILLSLDMDDSRAIMLILLFASPLIFISYNNALQAFLLISTVAAVLAGLQWREVREGYSSQATQLTYAAASTAVLIFSSNWFYDTLVPAAVGSLGASTALDIFQLTFFQSEDITRNPVFSEIIASRPPEVLYLGIGKYVIIGIALMAFGLFVLRDLFRGSRFSAPQLVILGFLGVGGGYFTARLLYGQFSYAVLFYPGVLALAWLHYRADSQTKQRAAYALTICFLVVSVATPATLAANGLIERDTGQYRYVEPTAEWYENYHSGVGTADLRTLHLFAAINSEQRLKRGQRDALGRITYQEMNPLDPTRYPAEVLGYKSNPVRADYVIVNKELGVVSIPAWASMKSWPTFSEETASPPGYHAVYNSGHIEIQKNID